MSYTLFAESGPSSPVLCPTCSPHPYFLPFPLRLLLSSRPCAGLDCLSTQAPRPPGPASLALQPIPAWACAREGPPGTSPPAAVPRSPYSSTQSSSARVCAWRLHLPSPTSTATSVAPAEPPVHEHAGCIQQIVPPLGTTGCCPASLCTGRAEPLVPCPCLCSEPALSPRFNLLNFFSLSSAVYGVPPMSFPGSLSSPSPDALPRSSLGAGTMSVSATFFLLGHDT